MSRPASRTIKAGSRDAYLARLVSPLSPQTMRRCSAPNATAVTLRLMRAIGSWRPWATAGTTRASSVL